MIGQEFWVIVERSNVQLGLVCYGKEITDKLDEKLSVVLLGSGTADLVDKLGECGAANLYVIADLPVEAYPAEAYTATLSILINEQHPREMLCGDTSLGRDLASRLSALLKIGVIPDCTAHNIVNGKLMSHVRSMYGGKVDATVVSSTTPVITVMKSRIATVKRKKADREPKVIVIPPELSRLRCRVTGFMKAEPKNLSVKEADVLVAGGRGIGRQENVQLLEELAELLGGTVAASRGAVDENWLPHKRLVGQTGTSVAPKLYIACGISGSIYHVLGIRDSEVIIAINKDRNAPIFNYADVGIVDDVAEVIPAIISELRELSKSTVCPDRKTSDGREI